MFGVLILEICREPESMAVWLQALSNLGKGVEEEWDMGKGLEAKWGKGKRLGKRLQMTGGPCAHCSHCSDCAHCAAVTDAQLVWSSGLQIATCNIAESGFGEAFI